MARPTKKMEADYEEFLIEIPMLLEDLQGLLRASRRYREVAVAFDDSTLARIEAFYLDVLAGKEKIGVSRARLDRIFIAYVGEAVRARSESGQARWALNPYDRDPSFGTPVIIDWAKGDGLAISPVERRELLVQNRKPFLRELVTYCATKQRFEADFFKEFE